MTMCDTELVRDGSVVTVRASVQLCRALGSESVREALCVEGKR